MELCKYLLMQGYSAHEITILTTYTGQMYLFREVGVTALTPGRLLQMTRLQFMCNLFQKKRESELLRNVKCIVVDKYQGEENRIILLSLVRSNKEGKIGFLRTENRVCVALSRAKEGFYMIGNMDNLCAASPLWSEIRNILQKDELIGKCCVIGFYYTKSVFKRTSP